MLSEFQRRIWAWCLDTVPGHVAVTARTARFLEEAIELAQATGLPEHAIHHLVAHVFGRPPGDAAQEVAGSLVTLVALAEALGVDAGEAGLREAARIETPEIVAKVRARQAGKDAVTASKPRASDWLRTCEGTWPWTHRPPSFGSDVYQPRWPGHRSFCLAWHADVIDVAIRDDGAECVLIDGRMTERTFTRPSDLRAALERLAADQGGD